MNKIKEYFHTDWAAMSQHDWLGLIMTILVFFIMIGLYTYVFHPSNKERFEAMRNIPLDEDCNLRENMLPEKTRTASKQSAISKGVETL